jgi:hypothetical protein
MSTITSLSVTSSGVITIQWEGVSETLLPPQAADLKASIVSGPGAVPVNGGQAPLNLEGWTSSGVIEHVTGTSPTAELVLTPPAQPSIIFQTGLIVMINFSLPTVNGARASQSFKASATVDDPYGSVINAIAGPGAPGRGIKQDLDFVTGFPLQVYDGYSMPSGGGGAASAAPSARAAVDAQMKAVLGRSTGTGGVTGTLAALDRSFQPVVSGGVDTWVWQPQSYVVQSDIGAGVTGEQASLARLATSIGDEILPLISGLQPLVPEAKVNPDEINAAKSIVASSWPAFVSEVGADGGPRITRAASLLEDAATSLVTLGILLATYVSRTSLVNIYPPPWGGRGGGAGVGATKFDWSKPGAPPSGWPAPSRANVVTADDEANYTNFVIASDRMQMVITVFQQLYYLQGGQVPSNQDRGFLVTLLQRALDSTGEAAGAVYAALDSVNLGPDERDIIFVPGTDPSAVSTTPPYSGTLTVEDIVSWAASFPAQEASSLLQDAGNVGINSIKNRAEDVQTAVGQLQAFAASGPPGLAHPRVTYALQILSDAVDDVVTYAGNASLGYATPTAP